MGQAPPAEPGKPELRIHVLDKRDQSLAAAIAGLHRQLLPTSPVVLLGTRFLGEFYYGLLPAHGLIRAAVAQVDGKAAGFVAVTNDPDRFMGVALRRWWHRLGWTLARSIAAEPVTRLAALREAVQLMAARGGQPNAADTAELLSLGVLPEYTHPRFVQESGLRIARTLIAQGVEMAREGGARRVLAIVDEDNRIAQMMYYGLGWTLRPEKPQGWRAPTVAFVKELSE